MQRVGERAGQTSKTAKLFVESALPYGIGNNVGLNGVRTIAATGDDCLGGDFLPRRSLHRDGHHQGGSARCISSSLAKNLGIQQVNTEPTKIRRTRAVTLTGDAKEEGDNFARIGVYDLEPHALTTDERGLL